MDLRIVNTCNNDCKYCLEQSFRKKEKFLNVNSIFQIIDEIMNDEQITFYWWNPLLHPSLDKIILYARGKWIKKFGVLTNSYWITQDKINFYKRIGLSSFGVFFNSFSLEKHRVIVWIKWIKLKIVLKNLLLFKKNNINLKVIIHINNVNILTLTRDISVLYRKFWIETFEFINYFPFDRPYKNYKSLLEYNITKNRPKIEELFVQIKRLNLSVKFVKFPRDFFGRNEDYYDFYDWIKSQISPYDIIRMEQETPFCYSEKRCIQCFLRDDCKAYVKQRDKN